MTIVTIEVATREESTARLLRAFNGESQGNFISFPTIEALLKALTAKRLQVIRTMLGAGSLTKVIFPYDALHMDFMLKAA